MSTFLHNILNKLSLHNRYLLLYFFVAFIPVFTTCLGLFISYEELYKETVAANQASVQLIQQSLDSKFQELNNVIMSIEQDPSLTEYSLSSSPRTALANLEKTVSLQDSLGDIIIKMRETDYYYSAGATYHSNELKYQTHMSNLIKNGYTVEEWENQFESTAHLTYWPVNEYSNLPNYLYIFSPVYSNFQFSNPNTSRVMVLLIKQDYILDLFRSSQTSIDESILLLDSDLQLLSHLTPNVSREALESICDFLKDTSFNSEDVLYLELDGKDNMIFASYSEATGFYYVRFLPQSTVFQTLNQLRTTILIILLVVLAVGICLITFSMSVSYHPIRTMGEWLHSIKPTVPDHSDELNLFKQVIVNVLEENESLSNKLEESQYVLIGHFLNALIQGKFSSKESFQNACRNLGIQFDKKYFSVCTVLIEEFVNSTENVPAFEVLLETIKKNLPENLQLQVKDLLFEKKLLLVFCCDIDSPIPFYRTLNDIKNNLFIHHGLYTTLAIGAFHDSYESVGKSYLESMNALDHRMIYGKNHLITQDMCNTTPCKLEYPSEALKALYSALIAKNITDALAITQQLYQYTKSSHCTLHAAKYICYDTFAILKRIPFFSKIGYINNLPYELNITHLVDYETIDDFFTSILNIVQNIAEAENTSQLQDNANIGSELVNYITTHCYSYNFQITTMAEYFSISPQYMRKVFKNHTGTSISEYITNLKLQKAMQLLTETDMNLQDIVIEIGNTDVSGFIRLFKQKTGITPGQYRKIYSVNK